MPYHFGNNEYNHLIGGTVGNVVIKDIEFSPDIIYMGTYGYAGNPYLLVLNNGKTFQFRQFQDVINKYGVFVPNPNPKQ